MNNVVRLSSNSEVFAIELTDRREQSVAYFYISLHYRLGDTSVERAHNTDEQHIDGAAHTPRNAQ